MKGALAPGCRVAESPRERSASTQRKPKNPVHLCPGSSPRRHKPVPRCLPHFHQNVIQHAVCHTAIEGATAALHTMCFSAASLALVCSEPWAQGSGKVRILLQMVAPVSIADMLDGYVNSSDAEQTLSARGLRCHIRHLPLTYVGAVQEAAKRPWYDPLPSCMSVFLQSTPNSLANASAWRLWHGSTARLPNSQCMLHQDARRPAWQYHSCRGRESSYQVRSALHSAYQSIQFSCHLGR